MTGIPGAKYLNPQELAIENVSSRVLSIPGLERA